MTTRRLNYLFNTVELELKRSIGVLTEKSSISKLYVDGKYECYILEDKDRGLTDSMSLSEIVAHKVYGETAIPKGRYQIVITESQRFKRKLPLLLNVKGYDGIRIHTGNVAADTHGCLLPCTVISKDAGSQSTQAFNKLYTKIEAALNNNQKVYITIS